MNGFLVYVFAKEHSMWVQNVQIIITTNWLHLMHLIFCSGGHSIVFTSEFGGAILSQVKPIDVTKVGSRPVSPTGSATAKR